MTHTPQKSLQEILEEAQTLPPEEQLRFVREACATDQKLYASALHELESRGAWMGDSGRVDLSAGDVPLPDPVGERIGPYRIVRSLGRGGMGEVFLAERADDQFRQQVAIKLVRRGLLSRHVQGRLKLERQILATLDHPNIARLLDGGTTPDGTPYIVMEYVDGEPIDVYCDRRALALEERLRLFRTVCSAVHRAHQNLIVHRDLKPSNILVTQGGSPKLLDFGIAKLLDDRQMMHTLAVTHADYRVMTPDHASPEQIRGEPITTASDIYVLGVLLYELLCGFKPFTLRGNRLTELEHAICEEVPLAPSAAAGAAERSGKSEIHRIAKDRSLSATRLRRGLAGDLDNIVLMAMRKEPERRYSSVEQFASDIDRYLANLPVLARADAWSYRAGKFIGRHRLVVGLSAAFLALLVGFSVTTYLQSKRIERERDVAQAERARARTEQERAEAVSAFLIDSFRLADPSQARGKDVTAREILDQGARRITNELRAQPVLQATLLDTIGSVYLSLDMPAQAKPLIERGLEVRRELFGPTHLDVARSLYSLNRVYEKQGDLTRARALALQSLAINRQLTGEDSVETAASLCRLGVIEHTRGELARAEELFRDCLRIRTARLGRDHELLTIPLDNLARLAQERGNFDDAERLYREALDIDRRTRGEDHPQYIRHLHNLATALHEEGEFDAAEPLYREALAQSRRVLGPEHSETIIATNSLGRLFMDKGQFEQARNAYEAALAANRKVHGPRHASVGYNLESLARLAFKQRRFDEAERYYKQALDIYTATLPPGHAYIAAAHTMLGRTLIESGRPREAQAVLARAVEEWSKEYGPGSAWYAMARAALGRAWALQGKLADAEPALTESYPVIAASPRGDEMAAIVGRWIEDLYRSMGRPEAAREYFAQAKAGERDDVAR